MRTTMDALRAEMERLARMMRDLDELLHGPAGPGAERAAAEFRVQQSAAAQPGVASGSCLPQGAVLLSALAERTTQATTAAIRGHCQAAAREGQTGAAHAAQGSEGQGGQPSGEAHAPAPQPADCPPNSKGDIDRRKFGDAIASAISALRYADKLGFEAGLPMGDGTRLALAKAKDELGRCEPRWRNG